MDESSRPVQTTPAKSPKRGRVKVIFVDCGYYWADWIKYPEPDKPLSRYLVERLTVLTVAMDAALERDDDAAVRALVEAELSICATLAADLPRHKRDAVLAAILIQDFHRAVMQIATACLAGTKAKIRISNATGGIFSRTSRTPFCGDFPMKKHKRKLPIARPDHTAQSASPALTACLFWTSPEEIMLADKEASNSLRIALESDATIDARELASLFD